MNKRTQSLLFAIAMIVFWPFIFLYLVAYHHFEDKQHIFATVLEYIEGIIVNVVYAITGKKKRNLFDTLWVDFWYSKGVYISKYTSLNKRDVKQLRNIIFLDYMYFNKTKSGVTFRDFGEVDDNSYTFSIHNKFRFEMDDSRVKPSIQGNIDSDFISRIKVWKQDGIF